MKVKQNSTLKQNQNKHLCDIISEVFQKSTLILLLDVHVMQESIKLGLLPEKSKASRKTALILSEKMKQIFPEDPCKADFALFGVEIDEEEK